MSASLNNKNSLLFFRRAVLVFVAAVVMGALGFIWLTNARPKFSQVPVLHQEATDQADQPAIKTVFFGTSKILLTDGDSAIMTDAFFSRPSFLNLLTSIEPDQDEINHAMKKVPNELDAIFVAHSHHDHAMDSGVVSQKTNAHVYGSTSTLNIARTQGVKENHLHALKVNLPIIVGKFLVTSFETPHSLDPVYPGYIDHPLYTPAKLADYRVAENYSFFVEHPLGNILIAPSANYVPGTFSGKHADTVFLGIATLGKQEDDFIEAYWAEVVKATGAKLVIPVHWDDFTVSLKKPLVPLPYFMDDMSRSMKRIQSMAIRDGVEIRFLHALQEQSLPHRQ
jgi:L-ascorbate metabolism protein UlaG (beta-lactamase superfamily)